MTFQQFLDSGLWREADVTRPVDAWRIGSLRRRVGDRVTRIREYQWYAAHVGQHDLGDALLLLFNAGPGTTMFSAITATEGGVPRKREWKDARKDVKLDGATCRCGFSGTVTAKSRLDAVCPECGSGTVRFEV